MIDTSRKGFSGKTLGVIPAAERTWGTTASVTASMLADAHIVRVHGVHQMVPVARVADAVFNPDSVSASTE